MPELSAEITLRPTRIGFLVSPTDLSAVRTIMRANACVWGGIYNPIIPVFKRAPREWRTEIYRRFNGTEVAKGYVRFFEPDVYVEAQKGLLEEAGLGALRQKHTLHSNVITLKEFLEPSQNRNWAEPAFGSNISEVFRHMYQTEQQFVLRHQRKSLYVSPDRRNCAVEAMFGTFPSMKTTKYFEENYRQLYETETVKSTPDVWREVFMKGAETPLRSTRHSLDVQRYWYHDLVIFVFDSTRPTDLIDLWNLRLEPNPVVPVPVNWFEELREDIYEILKDEHRPVVGNPSGMMHRATIEFGRSIPRSKAESLIESMKPKLPIGMLTVNTGATLYGKNIVKIKFIVMDGSKS